jgi:hypothetical protein
MPETILDRRFRFGAGFELLHFERLTDAEREACRHLRQEPGAFGLLREPAGGAVEVVGRDLALLLLALRQPGPLPAFARELGETELRRLVLDGVLEIETGAGFVAGPAAAGAHDPVACGIPPRGRLGELSRRALRYAAALRLTDAAALTWKLYRYNSLPRTGQRGRELGSEPGVREFLRLAALGRSPAPRPAAGGEPSGWISWPGHRRAGPGTAPTFKLYASPQLRDTPAALHALLPRLLERSALSVKVGATAENLLRPDKLVAYFESFEDLAAAAAAASTEIRDLAPQGVPFTAEIAADGLLSWGIDPDPGERRRLGLGAESWRYWLVHRLARALAAAGRPEDASGSPERFALERLALEGIDVEHWIPRASSWWRADGG